LVAYKSVVDYNEIIKGGKPNMNTIEIGKFIKEKLKQKGYTQDNLAEYLGVSKQAVSQNLSGRSTFETSNLMMISEYLDVTVDEILFAGEKRETLLSKYYNQEIGKFDSKNVPEQPDSLGKTLLDYCIQDNNIDKFNYFYSNKLIIDVLYNNPRFIAFLIRNGSIELLKSSFATPVKNEEGKIISYKYHLLEIPSLQEKQLNYNVDNPNPLYANLNEPIKEFVDSVLECNNEEILKIIPDLVLKRFNTDNITKLVLVAIEKDVASILRFYINQNKIIVDQNLFLICIAYKAYECAKFLFDNYEIKSISNLLKINDRDFIQDKISSMKLNQHQMSTGLISAVKAKDLMVVKALVKLVDKNAINLALEEVDFSESYDIAKVLLDAGAVFRIINAYDTSQRIELHAVTSAVKYLLEKLDDRDK